MNKIRNILLHAKHVKSNNWLKAIKILQEGVLDYPDSFELHYEMGKIFYNKKLYRKALEKFHKAIQTDLSIKKKDKLYFNIGNCYLSLHEYKLAIDYFNKIKKYFPEVSYNKAYAYSKLGKTREGIKLLKQVIKYKAKNEIPYLFLAELYYTENNYKKSIHYIEIAEQEFGHKGAFYYLKAAAYSSLKNWLKAYINFNLAKKHKFRFKYFWREYAISCEKIGKVDKAIKFFTKSIHKNPGDSQAYIELIKLYISRHKWQDALTVIELAKKNISENSFALNIIYNDLLKKMKLSKNN